MDYEKYNKLIQTAINAKKYSYSPYSKFRVGAAVLSEDGLIYGGCNVENASYSATICAERTAIFKSISEGANKIKAIAITSDSQEFAYPCGICRQVISEFGQDIDVILVNDLGHTRHTVISELLPHAFTLKTD